MDNYKKVLIFCLIWLKICIEAESATKVIETLTLSNNHYLPPPTSSKNINNVNKSQQHTKTYNTKPQRSLENFNTRPELKTSKYLTNEPSYPPLYSSYEPPPSGLVSHKNVHLPFGNSIKLPLLLPKPIKTNDFTKHPGFPVPAIPSEEIELENSRPMLMIEEPSAILLQPRYNKSIEAAKLLASTFLEDNSRTLNLDSSKPNNDTDLYVVKTQKKAYIIPSHLKKEASKPNAIDDLYPLRDQFEKAFTINQFIFVIKPEKINFLNKLV